MIYVLPRLILLLGWLLVPFLVLVPGISFGFAMRDTFLAMACALVFVRPSLSSLLFFSGVMGILLQEVCRYGIRSPWAYRSSLQESELCPHLIVPYNEVP
jgi:hypothetical protein